MARVLAPRRSGGRALLDRRRPKGRRRHSPSRPSGRLGQAVTIPWRGRFNVRMNHTKANAVFANRNTGDAAGIMSLILAAERSPDSTLRHSEGSHEDVCPCDDLVGCCPDYKGTCSRLTNVGTRRRKMRTRSSIRQLLRFAMRRTQKASPQTFKEVLVRSDGLVPLTRLDKVHCAPHSENDISPNACLIRVAVDLLADRRSNLVILGNNTAPLRTITNIPIAKFPKYSEFSTIVPFAGYAQTSRRDDAGGSFLDCCDSTLVVHGNNDLCRAPRSLARRCGAARVRNVHVGHFPATRTNNLLGIHAEPPASDDLVRDVGDDPGGALVYGYRRAAPFDWTPRQIRSFR